MNSISTHHQYSQPHRPSTIRELAARALDNLWDEKKELKYHLRAAEKSRREAQNFTQQGDLESAFIEFTKAATIVLEKLPTHRDYDTLLNDAQRHNLGLNGDDLLDKLGDLKPILVDRYEKWNTPLNQISSRPAKEDGRQEAAQDPLNVGLALWHHWQQSEEQLRRNGGQTKDSISDRRRPAALQAAARIQTPTVGHSIGQGQSQTQIHLMQNTFVQVQDQRQVVDDRQRREDERHWPTEAKKPQQAPEAHIPSRWDQANEESAHWRQQREKYLYGNGTQARGSTSDRRREAAIAAAPQAATPIQTPVDLHVGQTQGQTRAHLMQNTFVHAGDQRQGVGGRQMRKDERHWPTEAENLQQAQEALRFWAAEVERQQLQEDGLQGKVERLKRVDAGQKSQTETERQRRVDAAWGYNRPRREEESYGPTVEQNREQEAHRYETLTEIEERRVAGLFSHVGRDDLNESIFANTTYSREMEERPGLGPLIYLLKLNDTLTRI